ncbi:uroporphyrinogen-III synthase [Pseudidiomarina sp. WS423]|uniref:uroporphyrinogen-III synthase n=1 Tax=Pseudidiomarina sp. WS423 TaxID=3425124 RepID=UPI003D6EBBCF
MNHKLLILRPDEQSKPVQMRLQQQAKQLELGDLQTECFSMVKISSYDDPNSSYVQLLAEPWDAGLMVSVNAARYFAEQKQAWAADVPVPMARWFAVGPTSAAAIAATVGRPVTCPWRQHNSDALLELPELQQVAGQRWLLVRGHGGREVFAETLRARGADVHYLEVYQRTPVAIKPQLITQWQTQVQGIMVTSAEQLDYFLTAMPSSASTWLAQCYWVVASERLARMLPAPYQRACVVADSATPFALTQAWVKAIKNQQDTIL